METKSQEENKEEGDEKKDGDDKADGEGSNGDDGKASAKSEGSKKDEAGAQPAKPTGKKLPPVQSIAEKRAMDRMFLTKEAREYKEKLLDFVNEIVVR